MRSMKQIKELLEAGFTPAMIATMDGKNDTSVASPVAAKEEISVPEMAKEATPAVVENEIFKFVELPAITEAIKEDVLENGTTYHITGYFDGKERDWSKVAVSHDLLTNTTRYDDLSQVLENDYVVVVGRYENEKGKLFISTNIYYAGNVPSTNEWTLCDFDIKNSTINGVNVGFAGKRHIIKPIIKDMLNIGKQAVAAKKEQQIPTMNRRRR